MNKNTFNLIPNIVNNKDKVNNIQALLNSDTNVLTKNSSIKKVKIYYINLFQ